MLVPGQCGSHLVGVVDEGHEGDRRDHQQGSEDHHDDYAEEGRAEGPAAGVGLVPKSHPLDGRTVVITPPARRSSARARGPLGMGSWARDLGVVIGRLPPGARNAITDVVGVRVGHATLTREEPSVVRTGVTVAWPHGGAPWRDRVYAGTAILNGYGELIGINQVNEWGLLHSPVVITSSLAIGLAYDATARWIADRDPPPGPVRRVHAGRYQV